MRFLSVCSGIEAASVAWQPLGWHAVAFSEIEPFPCAVLAHHYPNTPNWGDMTKFKEWPDATVDLLCGGTPCQSFSVAGLRKGLADPRGNLMLTYLAIAARYRPRWLVWENVPGVLSSNRGRDFGALLEGLAELRYGFAYRVLDAQYFGVAQRRRRVFVVGCFRDWRRAAAVLFERASLSGHPAPSRQAGAAVAALTARGVGTCGADDNQGQAGHLITSTGELSHCLNAGGMGRQDYETETLIAHTLRGEGFDASEDGTGRGTPLVPVVFDTTQITSAENGSNPKPGDPCHPLAAGAHPPAIAFPANLSGTQCASAENLSPSLCAKNPTAVAQPYTLAIRGRGDSHALEYRQDGTANALLTPNGGRGGVGVGAIATEMQVRRLTPEECEALQGFPRGYTRIPWRGKPADKCPDGPRYRALGNSMAVPVMRWIGERIAQVEAITDSERSLEMAAA